MTAKYVSTKISQDEHEFYSQIVDKVSNWMSFYKDTELYELQSFIFKNFKLIKASRPSDITSLKIEMFNESEINLEKMMQLYYLAIHIFMKNRGFN